MDEKTERLRDLFIETTGAEAVTERQEESPGSLAGDAAPPPERVAAVVARMRERYEFRTALDDEALMGLAARFFDGADDGAIADALGVDPAAVFEARMDLHLVREADRDPSADAGPDSDSDPDLDFDALRDLHVEGVPIEERVDRLGADPETVRRYDRVVAADLASTRANDRFRDEFRALFTDAEIEGPLARDAREDGLAEATEDMETDVSF